jgi:hypothetical protein
VAAGRRAAAAAAAAARRVIGSGGSGAGPARTRSSESGANASSPRTSRRGRRWLQGQPAAEAQRRSADAARGELTDVEDVAAAREIENHAVGTAAAPVDSPDAQPHLRFIEGQERRNPVERERLVRRCVQPIDAELAREARAVVRRDLRASRQPTFACASDDVAQVQPQCHRSPSAIHPRCCVGLRGLERAVDPQLVPAHSHLPGENDLASVASLPEGAFDLHAIGAQRGVKRR